jgi:hypothetical protein
MWRKKLREKREKNAAGGHPDNQLNYKIIYLVMNEDQSRVNPL